MRFKKQEIEIVERMIQLNLEGFIEDYLKGRFVPLYVYIRWAELAKDFGHLNILKLLHNNQTKTELNQFNKLPKPKERY